MAESKNPGRPEPFEFWRTVSLVQVTALRARSLGQLLAAVTLASEGSIYYHLHRRLTHEPETLPSYPNDFAAWAFDELGDAVVAERLANLNLARSLSLAEVRREISVILAERLAEHGDERIVEPDGTFIFCEPRPVLFPSGRQARTPAEFVDALRTIEVDAIELHLFTPKLLRGATSNDFAVWFRQRGYTALAQQLDGFDPYLNSLEDNRAYLLELVQAKLREAPRRGREHD